MGKILFIFYFLLGTLVVAAQDLNTRTHYKDVSKNVVLADDGKSYFKVIIANNASPEIKQTASLLAQYLGKITGALFEVESGDGSKGIVVGSISDFPNIGIEGKLDPTHPGQRQSYEIKTHENGLSIIGASNLAVQYAVFHFLESLGYRKFFPTEKWEIIPALKRLEFSSHIRESPDYFYRNIWPGHGLWPEFTTSSQLWNIANRNGGYTLNTGHAYDDIVLNNKKEFDAHPEYYSEVNGKRRIVTQEIKFCTSNEELQKLVIKHALSKFENNSQLESISMDPSDGGGWCECDKCMAMGTPSTRAVFLANRVAQAVRQNFKGKKIGIYAYNMHSPPPGIDVDQDVVTSIATSYIAGGRTLDEIISGWSARNATLGIREYYDVYIWSKFLAGRSLGSNFDYLAKTIPDFYLKGARYLSSEASDDWAPTGLGYYIANKLLWNFDEAKNIASIKNDFLEKSFGPSQEPMKTFLTFLDGSQPKVLASDPIGRMYRYLDTARKQAGNRKEILDRIDDFVLYTRYLELFKDFDAANNLKQEAFEKLMDFISGIKDYRIIHTKAIEDGIHWQNLSPAKERYKKPDWEKSKRSYSPAEIDLIISEGIANNELFDFDPIGFSDNLVPTSSFDKNEYAFGTLAARRGDRTYYTWVDSRLQPITIMLTGGLITQYRNRGNVKVKFYKVGGASETGARETLIQEDTSTRPNGIMNLVTLVPKQEGLHLVTISDGMDMTSDMWTNYDKTFKADGELDGTFYFYVPKGTKKIGMFHKLWRGKLLDSDGNEIFTFENTNRFQSFPVKKGQDGKIWSFKSAKGIINLMTTPPYFSLNSKYLLIPEEIATKDNLKNNKSNRSK